MQIKDIFELEIERYIPPVSKVNDIDPEIIDQELREYIITSPIEDALRDLLETYAESRMEKTDKIGVWISGFFGSGKSHFAKIVSYLLRNIDVRKQAAIDVFRKRLTPNSDLSLEIEQLLHRIQQIDSHVVMFNIESKKVGDSIAETMYSQYLEQERGLSPNIVVGRLELSLIRRGLYEDFKKEVQTLVDEPWEVVRGDFSMVRSSVAQVLTKLDNTVYPDIDTAAKALDDLTNQAAINISGMTKELASYVDTLQAQGNIERPPHLVFIIDEIGQYVGRKKDRLLELQTIAEDLGTEGRGKVWLLVTSQQELESLVADIASAQDEFGRIITRFGTRLLLTSADVERVLADRVLKKNAEGEQQLLGLYKNHGGSLDALNQLPGATRDLPQLDEDIFAAFYPFLPYQFTVVQDIFKLARTGVSTGFTLNTEARSMLGMTQGVILKKILDAQIGTIVALDDVFDQVVLDLNQADVREINKVVDQLPKATPLDTRVVKALYFIQQISYLTCTPDLLASVLIHNPIQENVNALKKDIEASLSRLDEAGFVVKTDGQVYEFLTGAKKGFEKDVSGIKVKKNHQRRTLRDRLVEVLREVGRLDYEKMRTFRVAVYADGEKANNEKDDLVMQVYSPLHIELEDSLTVDAIELESFSNPNTVYWISHPNDELKGQVSRVYQLGEVLKARKSQSGKTDDDRALIREKDTELANLRTAVERGLRSALYGGAIIWSGHVEEQDGKTTNLNVIFNKALSQVVPHVFPKLEMAAVKPDSRAIETVLTAANYTLNTIHPGLGLFDQSNHLNHASPAVDEVLRELKRREEKGLDKEGKTILDHFESIPYGWHPEVIRLIIAAIFRGGMLTIKSGNVSYDDHNSPAARDKLIKTNDFKKAIFIYEEEETVSLSERQEAQSKLFALFQRASMKDTPASLMAYVQEDLGNLQSRVERLALQLRQEQYPLPASFLSVRDTLLNVTSHTKPNKVVRAFLNQHEAIKELKTNVDTLHQFVEFDKRLPAFRQARTLLEAYRKAHQVYGATTLRADKAISNAEALQAGFQDGIAQPAQWQPFIRAYDALLKSYQQAYETLHQERDQKYQQIIADLETEGISTAGLGKYACSDLKFVPETCICATCGNLYSLLDEQLLGMPAAAKRLREFHREKLEIEKGIQRKVAKVHISSLLAGKQIENEAQLDEALGTIKTAAKKKLQDNDAVELT